MMEETNMQLKNPEEIIKALRQRYTVREDNLTNLDKIFVAASIVRWVFANTKDTNEILQYLTQVERYMNNQINLYWSDGVIKVGQVKKGKL